jgi:hypothetical protein
MEKRHRIVGLALAASGIAWAATAIPGTAVAGSPPPNGVATNLPNVFAVPAPQAGFDPLVATDAQLAKAGFPPRPDRHTSPGGYAAWKRAMSAGATRVVPKLEQTNITHGPAKIKDHSAITNGQATSKSGNWSGDAIVTGYTGRTPPTYYYLIGDYVIPIARQAIGRCDGTWDYSSEWVGIDGYGSNDVLQAGVEADAFCSGSTKSTFYSAWYEWFPFSEVRISSSSFPVGPGNDVFVEVWSTSATAGHAYLYNYYTNIAVSLSFSAPSGTTLQGNSAEWVVERPGVGGSLANLAGYGQDFFTDAYAYDYYGDQYTPGQPGSRTNYNITMIDSNGNALSTAQNAGPDVNGTTNAIWFQATGAAF